MRVTQSMLSSNSLKNLSESYRRMDKYQDQLATGKKITKPSDDPVVAMKGMFYRSNLTEVEQYKRNLSELYLWMENSEAGLEHANNGLQRVRELVIQGKNGTLSSTERQAIAEEIGQIKEDLVGVANTQVSGRYIFHGTDTDTAPITMGSPPTADPNMALDEIKNYKIEISRGVTLRANVDPAKVFNDKLFTTVDDIEKALTNDQPQELDRLLGDLDDIMDDISEERSELGARYNRLEMIDVRISQQEIIASRVLSDNEDADIERVITDLKTQESVHRAALGVGARILQPTLLDFLR